MDENTVHYGSEPESRWRRFTRRTVLIPLIAILLIALGAWVFYSLRKDSTKKESTLNSALRSADAAFQTGDYQKSIDNLKNAADSADSKQEKVELYSQLAAASASAGKWDDALRYFEQKHELDPSTAKSDAYLIGSYYESIGENQKAADYYKDYLEYLELQQKTDRRDNDIQSLKARVESLEEQQ